MQVVDSMALSALMLYRCERKAMLVSWEYVPTDHLGKSLGGAVDALVCLAELRGRSICGNDADVELAKSQSLSRSVVLELTVSLEFSICSL